VAIFDSEGELLHATAAHNNQPQVQIFFVKPFEEASSLKVQLQGRVYGLRDITEIFIFQENEFGSALVCSRVPWTQALSLTFGSEFKCLMDMPRSVCNALLCAGRVFDAIVKAESEVSANERQHHQTYFQDGRGRGFVAFAVALFPEMEPVKEHINVADVGTFRAACETYDSSKAHIKKACGCSICKNGISHGLEEESFCLVLLMEAIIVVIQSMLGISVPPTLYPVRSGLEAFYRQQLKLHEFEKIRERIKKYGAIGAVLEFNPDECEDWNQEESVAIRRVIDAARLFTGRDIQRISDDQVAISLSGIVVFLDTLLDRGMPVDFELMGRCTVINGHIEMHGRSYAHLEDLSDYDLVGMENRNRRDGGIAPEPLFDPSTLTDNYDRVSLVAKEGVESVRVGLQFHEKASGSQEGRSIILGPANMARVVLQATGLVGCDGRTCERTQESAIEFREVSDCVKTVATPGQCQIWVYQGNALGRVIALHRILDIQPTYYEILQHKECMNCCMRAAELSEFEKAIIFTKMPSKPRRRICEA
jgi:hypothetical protein